MATRLPAFWQNWAFQIAVLLKGSSSAVGCLQAKPVSVWLPLPAGFGAVIKLVRKGEHEFVLKSGEFPPK